MNMVSPSFRRLAIDLGVRAYLRRHPSPSPHVAPPSQQPPSVAVAETIPPQDASDDLWVTGRCWLYCRKPDIPVMWLGPARTPKGCGDMFGCEICIAELVHIVDQQQEERYALP